MERKFRHILETAEYAYKVVTGTTVIPVDPEFKLSVLRGAALMIQNELDALKVNLPADC